MESYLAAWGFPLESRSMANRWTRVAFSTEVVAVVGEVVQPGTDVLYVVDLYPGTGRYGTLGVYAVVEVVKHLTDTGAIAGISWMSAVENESHTRALKRVLGIKPLMYTWMYGSLPSLAPHESGATSEIAISAQTSQCSPNEDTILCVGSAVLNRACRDVFGERE